MHQEYITKQKQQQIRVHTYTYNTKTAELKPKKKHQARRWKKHTNMTNLLSYVVLAEVKSTSFFVLSIKTLLLFLLLLLQSIYLYSRLINIIMNYICTNIIYCDCLFSTTKINSKWWNWFIEYSWFIDHFFWGICSCWCCSFVRFRWMPSMQGNHFDRMCTHRVHIGCCTH